MRENPHYNLWKMRINELWKDSTIDGIFTYLNYYNVPWKSLLTNAEIQGLNVKYHRLHSGKKIISPLIESLAEYDENNNEWKLDSNAKQTAALAAYLTYSDSWNHLYDTILAEYNPIDNYNIVEEEVIDNENEETNTDTITSTNENIVNSTGEDKNTGTITDLLTSLYIASNTSIKQFEHQSDNTLTLDTNVTENQNMSSNENDNESSSNQTNRTLDGEENRDNTLTLNTLENNSNTGTVTLANTKVYTASKTSLFIASSSNLENINTEIDGEKNNTGTVADSQSTIYNTSTDISKTGTIETENVTTYSSGKRLDYIGSNTRLIVSSGTDNTNQSSNDTQNGSINENINDNNKNDVMSSMNKDFGKAGFNSTDYVKDSNETGQDNSLTLASRTSIKINTSLLNSSNTSITNNSKFNNSSDTFNNNLSDIESKTGHDDLDSTVTNNLLDSTTHTGTDSLSATKTNNLKEINESTENTSKTVNNNENNSGNENENSNEQLNSLTTNNLLSQVSRTGTEDNNSTLTNTENEISNFLSSVTKIVTSSQDNEIVTLKSGSESTVINKSEDENISSNETVNENNSNTRTNNFKVESINRQVQNQDSTINKSNSKNGSLSQNRNLQKHGNIGVTTTQDLLNQERETWLWSFFNQVMNDLDNILCIEVY